MVKIGCDVEISTGIRPQSPTQCLQLTKYGNKLEIAKNIAIELNKPKVESQHML
jgi:hypothetical protein